MAATRPRASALSLDVKQGLTDYEETVPGFYHYQIKLGELEWYIAKTPQPWITLIDNVSRWRRVLPGYVL